jgi:glycerol-3-phosphate O-acyltransferase
VIYVPCHRSHIDYLLLSYLLFRNGLTPPHIAAGINLNMPVIGGLLRRGGAFFMRRTFKGNPLYTAVFNEYLHTLFTKGFPVEYFVEGGRSRTGRMLQPRTGMLAITLRSFLRSSRTPIVFVPVYIGYERVLEGRTYLGELRGASKKKESIFDIFKVFGALKQRFGQVASTSANRSAWPVPRRAAARLARAATGPSSARTGSTTPPPPGRNRGPSPQRGGRDQPGQPGGPGAAVHQPPGPGRARPDPCARPVPGLAAPGALLAPHHLARGRRQALIKHVQGMDLLAEQKDALGRILYLDEANAVLMTYYRNNVLHIFALPALLASFFLSSSRMSRELVGRTRRCTRTCRPSCSCAGRPSNWTRSSTNGWRRWSSKACCASRTTCTCARRPARGSSCC